MDTAVQWLKRTYLRMKYYRYGWKGNYPSWPAAVAASGGYSAPAILQKVQQAAVQVKNGIAVYEKDGVLYPAIGYSWPLLASLLHIAAVNGNRLSVLDVGGGLGSSYFQNRDWLQHLQQLEWSVVEQPDFVDAGKKEIAHNGLDFFRSVDEAIAGRGLPDVLLLSCVLPYLESPYLVMEDLMRRNFPYIIIDDTYFNNQAGDRLTVQHVPPFYYEASYPAWFLDYEKLKRLLEKAYVAVAAYRNEQILYLDGERIFYRGLLLKKLP